MSRLRLITSLIVFASLLMPGVAPVPLNVPDQPPTAEAQLNCALYLMRDTICDLDLEGTPIRNDGSNTSRSYQESEPYCSAGINGRQIDRVYNARGTIQREASKRWADTFEGEWLRIGEQQASYNNATSFYWQQAAADMYALVLGVRGTASRPDHSIGNNNQRWFTDKDTLHPARVTQSSGNWYESAIGRGSVTTPTGRREMTYVPRVNPATTTLLTNPRGGWDLEPIPDGSGWRIPEDTSVIFQQVFGNDPYPASLVRQLYSKGGGEGDWGSNAVRDRVKGLGWVPVPMDIAINDGSRRNTLILKDTQWKDVAWDLAGRSIGSVVVPNLTPFAGTPRYKARIYYNGHRSAYQATAQVNDAYRALTESEYRVWSGPYNPSRREFYLPNIYFAVPNTNGNNRCNFLNIALNAGELNGRPGLSCAVLQGGDGCYFAWRRFRRTPPRISTAAFSSIVQNMLYPVYYEAPGSAEGGLLIGNTGEVFPATTNPPQDPLKFSGGTTVRVGGLDRNYPQLAINVRQLGVYATLGGQQWSDTRTWNMGISPSGAAVYRNNYRLTLRAFERTPLSVSLDPSDPLYSSVVWCAKPRPGDGGETLRRLVNECRTPAQEPGREMEARFHMRIHTIWTGAYSASVLEDANGNSVWRPFFNCWTAKIPGCSSGASFGSPWNSAGYWGNTSILRWNAGRWGGSVAPYGDRIGYSPNGPRLPDYQPIWPDLMPPRNEVGTWDMTTDLYVRVLQAQGR